MTVIDEAIDNLDSVLRHEGSEALSAPFVDSREEILPNDFEHFFRGVANIVTRGTMQGWVHVKGHSGSPESFCWHTGVDAGVMMQFFKNKTGVDSRVWGFRYYPKSEADQYSGPSDSGASSSRFCDSTETVTRPRRSISAVSGNRFCDPTETVQQSGRASTTGSTRVQGLLDSIHHRLTALESVNSSTRNATRY